MPTSNTPNGHLPLTLQQFQKILMPQIVNVVNSAVGEVKNELLDKINHLPSKKEYFDREDRTMGELKKLREEVALTVQHYKDTNKRVDKIDRHLGINTILQISTSN